MKRIVVSLFVSLVCCGVLQAQQSSPISGNENHDITLTNAKVLVKNYQSAAVHDSLRAGLFGRGIIDRILAQTGVKGLRIYNAKKSDGSLTFVIVGVDSTGTDVKSSLLGEEILPCPPYCGTSSEVSGK